VFCPPRTPAVAAPQRIWGCCHRLGPSSVSMTLRAPPPLISPCLTSLPYLRQPRSPRWPSPAIRDRRHRETPPHRLFFCPARWPNTTVSPHRYDLAQRTPLKLTPPAMLRLDPGRTTLGEQRAAWPRPFRPRAGKRSRPPRHRTVAVGRNQPKGWTLLCFFIILKMIK
jgi:hypothetical protein